jgi:hypothetical protein
MEDAAFPEAETVAAWVAKIAAATPVPVRR